eukprot:TRINITY_DN26671_c0_g1_i2.p1 TRINITY_DN26671_c0_g1~~TRINITY_DN26671_c0_g1_i2.p1  ORF type:complete len:540 (+),score=146.25 TRINITY_DN26671_c0_g1_i2:39-1658(+)
MVVMSDSAHQVSALCSCTVAQANDLLREHSSVQAAVNSFWESDSRPVEFENMSLKQLREHVHSLGCSTHGLLEKSDLVVRATQAAGGKSYAFMKPSQQQQQEEEQQHPARVLSFEEVVYEALGREPTASAGVSSVTEQLESLERDHLADRIEQDCLSSVKPAQTAEYIAQIAARLHALTEQRSVTRKSIQRLFSTMTSAVGLDPAQMGRHKTVEKAEHALNQMSDLLDIKVRPIGAQQDGGLEQLLEEGALAGNVASQAMEVLRCLADLLPGALAEDRLEAAMVNIQGMQGEFGAHWEGATAAVNELSAKVASAHQQRTSTARQLNEREEALLSRLEQEKQTVGLCQAVDHELNQCMLERSHKQQHWNKKLDELYREWQAHEQEQLGWQASLDCLQLGIGLNQQLAEAAKTHAAQLRLSVTERAGGVEAQFVRAMVSCTCADTKSVQALQTKQQRLRDTLSSTQAVLDTEAPQTDAMNQVVTTLTNEMDSVANRLDALFISAEKRLEMLDRFRQASESCSDETMAELKDGIDQLLAKQA